MLRYLVPLLSWSYDDPRPSITSNDMTPYQPMVDKHYLKEEEKNKYFLSRSIAPNCLLINKTICTSHFQNICKNKHFRIHSQRYENHYKRALHWHFQTYFLTLIFKQNIFKTNTLYILNDTRINAKFAKLRHFQNIFKLPQTQRILKWSSN